MITRIIGFIIWLLIVVAMLRFFVGAKRGDEPRKKPDENGKAGDGA